MTEETSHTVEEEGRAPHGPTWPWALGSLLLVALVLAAMVGGRVLVLRSQQSQQPVVKPTVPPTSVVTVVRPAGGAQLLALDSNAGRLAVLTSSKETPACPPVGACPAPAHPDAFALLNGSTGATIVSIPLLGIAAQAADASQLLVDSFSHVAYAVSPHAVVTFSTKTGFPIREYTLPTAGQNDRFVGAALTPGEGRLVVVTSGYVRVLNAASGNILGQQSLPAGMTALDGPVLDANDGTCYVLATTSGQTWLLAFSPPPISQDGMYSMPVGSRLGAIDVDRQTLYFLRPDGVTLSGALNALKDLGFGGSTLTLTPISMLFGAKAFGSNVVLSHSYFADGDGLHVFDNGYNHLLTSLPLHVLWPPTQPLPVDQERGLLYVLGEHGSVVILKDERPPSPLSAATATLLARAALTTLITDPNQDPPFVSAETFPLSAGTPEQPVSRPEQYWIHFSDLGWQGPYPGTASTAVASASGQPGAYTVTFSVSWKQLFPRQHTWTCLVTPDGAVKLLSDQGDAIP